MEDDGYARIELVDADPRSLFQDSEDDPNLIPPQGLRITSLMGSHDRTLMFKNGVIFSSTDGTTFDHCLKGFVKQPSAFVLHRLERYLSLALVGIVLMVVIGYAGFRWGAPAVSSWIADQIPVSVIAKYSKGLLTYLDKMGFEPTNTPQAEQDRLTDYFFETFPGALEDGVKVHFRASEKYGANAFALPTGDVVFTDAMLNLAEKDEELLGVFVHEWGHVHHKHGLRNAIQSALIAWLFIVYTGDLSIGADSITGFPAIIASLAYSRDFEREADLFALEKMREQNISPSYLADLLERLMRTMRNSDDVRRGKDIHDHPESEEEGLVTLEHLESLLSTHPVTRERLEMLRSPE